MRLDDARAIARRVRDVLVAAAVMRALLVAVASTLLLLALVAVVDLVVPLGAGTRLLLRGVAIVAGLLAGGVAWWRARRVVAVPAVALWLEERLPSLDYALVTAVDDAGGDRAALHAAVARAPWRAETRRRALRGLRLPAVAVAIAALAIASLPEGSRARVRAPRTGDALLRPEIGEPRSRLSPIVARVAAPRYAGGGVTSVEEPATIAALAGSVVTIEGRGEAGVSAAAEPGGAIRVIAHGGRWRATLQVPTRAVLVRLRDGGDERLVAIDARPDRPPQVALRAPARDTVLREGKGRVALEARATDDIGIASARFEVIVSSGEGESFTFRSAALGARAWRQGGRRDASIAAVLSLDSLALKPGDLLHLRAVAADANTVTGPGVGSSETRTIRIARQGEYDSVSVDPAPPATDEKAALSQRMLIMLTEALERRRPRLARPVLLAESQRIARDQAKLRKLVGEVIFMRLSGDGEAEHSHADGSPHDPEAELLEQARAASAQAANPDHPHPDESPVVAINKPLLEAYNAMWDAGRELEQAAPRAALPHMRRALAAIQRARQAERIYLRGRPPVAVVDLARVRLSGKDKGEPGVRAPLPAVDPAGAARARRLARALALAERDAGAAVDSLLVLRVETVGEAPALASALDALAEALRRGRDATDHVRRARRAAAGEPVALESLGRWQGALP